MFESVKNKDKVADETPFVCVLFVVKAFGKN